MLPARLSDQANAASSAAHHLYSLPPFFSANKNMKKGSLFGQIVHIYLHSGLSLSPTKKASPSQAALLWANSAIAPIIILLLL
tara:strand:- start:980 stop:1228 length:249 start_codon:yes stop_codon:yes gene_type:complete